MKVRVVSLLNNQTCWYKIGDEYDVLPYYKDEKYDDTYYMIKGWNGYFENEGANIGRSNLGKRYWLFVKDCEIIPEYKIVIDEDLFIL
jgi:hypothetical protein